MIADECFSTASHKNSFKKNGGALVRWLRSNFTGGFATTGDSTTTGGVASTGDPPVRVVPP